MALKTREYYYKVYTKMDIKQTVSSSRLVSEITGSIIINNKPAVISKIKNEL